MLKKTIICLLGLTAPFGLWACSNGNSSSEAAGDAATEVIGNESAKDAKYRIVDNVIISENMPVVVDFYADWCGPCKRYSPVFHEVAEAFDGQAIFLSINIDEQPELAKNYNFTAIPATAFIMPGGSVLGVEQGLMSAEDLQSKVLQLIETSAGEEMSL